MAATRHLLKAVRVHDQLLTLTNLTPTPTKSNPRDIEGR